MEQWVDEVNFDDRGAFLAAAAPASAAVNAPSSCGRRGEHGSSGVDGDARVESARTPDSHAVHSQWPATPTPCATQDPHQHAALGPCFETYLGVPPAFIFQFARTRTEATLLYDVTCVAMEMDVLLDNVSEQLHDRSRISDSLCASIAVDAVQRGQQGLLIDTALVALQRQAHHVNARNVELLLQRFQACLHKLHDLQFPLAQSTEANVSTADDLEDCGDADGAAVRRKLVQVQVTLLERLQSLQDGDVIALSSKLVVPSESQQTRTNVCWPAASNSDDSKQSVSLDDVRLSSSSGSTHASFSLASPNQESRRLMEAEDLDITTSLDRHGSTADKQQRDSSNANGDEDEYPHNQDGRRTKDRLDGQQRDSLELSSQYGGRHLADAQRERGLSEELSSSNEHIYSESVY